jgi:hypothetical protein
MKKLYLKFNNNNYFICEEIVRESVLLMYLKQTLLPKNNIYVIDMSLAPIKEEAVKWFKTSNINLYKNNILIDCMNAFDYLSCKKHFLYCGERYCEELKLSILQTCNNNFNFYNQTNIFFKIKFEKELDIFDIQNIFGENFLENPNFILLKSYIKINGDHIKKENLKLFKGVKSITINGVEELII